MPSTRHWSAYDGRARRPRAEALRAVCACGWRGAAEYPLDWATVGDQPLYEADVDLSGALADWTAHLSVVREVAVPLPEPLSALRAAGVLERIAARVGREAAGALCGDGLSAEAVATGLGTTYSKALVMLPTEQDR
ncbi:hypothetical protein ACGFNX_27050 [Streptomyces sp. NPDC048723]|uniref:hypothetical protein n=1 Tax=Streptomyces sp. NPDC048723 TaxID=3365589 RepID=UPI00370F88C1